MTENRIDKAIYDISYVFEVLRSYRDIVNSGNCNECMKSLECKYCPKPGQLVRYNCPFFKRKTK